MKEQRRCERKRESPLNHLPFTCFVEEAKALFGSSITKKKRKNSDQERRRERKRRKELGWWVLNRITYKKKKLLQRCSLV